MTKNRNRNDRPETVETETVETVNVETTETEPTEIVETETVETETVDEIGTLIDRLPNIVGTVEIVSVLRSVGFPTVTGKTLRRTLRRLIPDNGYTKYRFRKSDVRYIVDTFRTERSEIENRKRLSTENRLTETEPKPVFVLTENGFRPVTEPTE